MKFNPKLFAGGAIVGAGLTEASSDNTDLTATFLGGAIGGFTGNNLNTSLPRNSLDPINTRMDLSGSINPSRNKREDMLSEIVSGLRDKSTDSSFTGDFSFTSPMSTVGASNVDSVIEQYGQLNDTELQRSYLNFKHNRNVYTNLQNSAGEASLNGYSPSRVMVTETASLADRQNALYSYLTTVSGESDAFARQRVDEISPFLGKLTSNMTIADGTLSTNAFGSNMNIALTQTIGDGVTQGYSSNNNVYLANTYNLTGSILAEPQGNSPEAFKAIAKAIGIESSDSAMRSLETMLVDKQGITKEGVLGFLSSMNLSDDSMSDAIKMLEGNKQWDEHSTSELLKSRIADLDGKTYQRDVSEYAKSISNLVDFGTTLKYQVSSNTVDQSNGTALRSVRATAKNTGEASELAKLRRNLSQDGEDRFSQVKADASAKFTGTDHTADSPSMFTPVKRNANSVTRRATQAPADKREKNLSNAFNKFKETFKGDSTLSSAVPLRTETFDMEKVGDTFSKVLGGNVTLADGYSLGNASRLSKLSTEGIRKVSIASDANNNVALTNPLMSKMLNNEVSLSTVKIQAQAAETLRPFNMSKNQSLGFAEFKSNIEKLNSAVDLIDAEDRLAAGVSDKYEKVFTNAYTSTAEFAKRAKYTDDNPILVKKLREQYINEMGDKLELGLKSIDKTNNAFARQAMVTYNRTIGDVIGLAHRGELDKAEALFGEAVTTFNAARQDSLYSDRLVNKNRAGTTVGYDSSGAAVQVPEAHSNYTLENIETRVDAAGKATLDAYYKGKLDLDENSVGKGFGINSKEQFLVTRADDVGRAGVLGTLMEKGIIEDTGSSIKIRGQFASTGLDTILKYDDFKDQLTNPSAFNDKTGATIQNTYDYFSSQVDMISDTKNAGFGNERDILKALKNKAGSSEFLTDTVWNSLRDYQDKNNVGKKELAGLVNYGLATTNEKASLATLANVVMGNEQRFSKLIKDSKKGVIEDNKALQQFKKLVPTFTPSVPTTSENKEQIFKEMRDSLDNMHATVATRFNDRTAVYDMLSNGSSRDSTIDFFVQSAKFTSDTKNSRMSFSALNRTAISETGAGSTGKSMSWNAQLQLLSGGYSYEDLDAFGKFDKSSLNDLKAIVGMNSTHENSANDVLDYSKNTQFKNAFNALPQDRRKIFESIGLSTGNDVDFYNLSYVPEGSFKSVPIIYDETRLFDSYTSTKTGAETNKRATSLMYEIIQTDMELQNAKNAGVQQGLKEQLDTLHARLQGHIDPALSGSTSAGKAALTRTANASMQATVGAINGHMSDFLSQQKADGLSASFVAVSGEGALKRLRLAGVEVADLEELNQKHLSRIGETSLYRLNLSDGNPFFGMVNREPATGPMSARLAEYVVDMSILGEGSKDSLFIKSDEDFYKLFQFGDYDFDNVTEYFVDDIEKKSLVEREAILNKGRKVAQEYGALSSFAEKLGVKNNKSNKMDSLFDLYEKNKGKIKSKEDWNRIYIEHVESASRQAGLRKSVSPQVTMIAAALNNSLMRDSTGDDKGVKAARILSHYFVENLLKAQHATADGASINTEAERLSIARTNAIKSQTSKEYLDMLDTSLKSMLEKHKGDQANHDLGLDAVKRIVQAEEQYLTGSPINSMELGSSGMGKNFSQKIDNLANMIDGEEQAIPLFKRVAEEDVDVAKTAKVGYDRFKNITNNFLKKNKKALAIGAGGLGAVALAFQNKPGSGATADVGRQTLAPSTMSDQESSRQLVGGRDFSRTPEYITPHRDARQAVTIEGQYVGDSEDYRENSRQSIFGDNINSAQVEYRE